MKNYALIVEYDGCAFSGWQRQQNAPSVQQTLEDAIWQAMKERVNLIGAGRTDAGVHAQGQVCNFRSNTRIPADKLPFVLNRALPHTVQVQDAFEVPWGFHARYLAQGKHYRYIVRVTRFPSALWHHRAWQMPYRLDMEAMRRAAAALAGTHDFKAFCASGSEVKSTVRTLHRIEIKKEGSDIYFDFFGNGFLYNMVRILVGTLVYVGQGRINAGQVGEILRSTDRRLAGITAPPYGLYMVSVRYARRYIAMLRPRPWPSGRGGCHMPPVSKMKKHQLTHACHNQARVFALKNGKIHAMDFKTKPGESSNNA